MNLPRPNYDLVIVDEFDSCLKICLDVGMSNHLEAWLKIRREHLAPHRFWLDQVGLGAGDYGGEHRQEDAESARQLSQTEVVGHAGTASV
jgi:hypothetical protein